MISVDHGAVRDPFPELALADILPICARARSLFVRSKRHPVVEGHVVHIWGALDMMDALEYHRDNFVNALYELSTFAPVFALQATDESVARLRHEAVAYLNRLGQFYYFAKSNFVTAHVSDLDRIIPTISKFKRFRDKHAAHRSIDCPRSEDAWVQSLQAWALSSVSGLAFRAKVPMEDNARVIQERVLSKAGWTDFYIGFQMGFGNQADDFEDFFLEREHPVISLEAFNVLEQLFR